MTHSEADYSRSVSPTIPKKEQWKPVPGYPNYQASNLGRIRSVRVRVLKQRFNHITLRGDQYLMVHIGNRWVLVHRLVAAAFNGPRPHNKIVHHRDHTKTNNKPYNLEYVTPSQNTKLAYAEGKIGKTLKLTAFARKKIVELYETGKHRTANLAKQFGVSKSTILLCIRRAGLIPHRMRKLTPVLYEEIWKKWVPYKYPAARLAKEYGVSVHMIELILGLYKRRVPHHAPELEATK